MVEEHCVIIEAEAVRHCGGYRRENAGISSARGVRISPVENPRFPEQGSSTQGKSGPKARPQGVVDGQQVEIPVPKTAMKMWGRRRIGAAPSW